MGMLSILRVEDDPSHGQPIVAPSLVADVVTLAILTDLVPQMCRKAS